MIENLEFEEYLRMIRAEILDKTNESLEDGYPVNRFTQFCVQSLGDYGQMVDANVLFFERADGRAKVSCNGWEIDRDEGRLIIVVTIFNDTDKPVSVGKQDIDNAVKRATRVLDFSRNVDIDRLDPSSPEYPMIRSVKDEISTITQIQIYVLTDGVMKDTTDVTAEHDDLPVYINYWDIQRLYRLSSSGREYEPIDIDFGKKYDVELRCLSMPTNTDEYQGYLAILPGDILAAMYEEYGSRLMELNVRSFLQQRGKVNRGIRETILNEPHRFLAYNNGISATAESISVERTPQGDMAIRSITGLQVVNGGQTVASIHRAMKADRCAHLGKVAVQAKITVVEHELLDELVPKISRFSNTQNKVNEADFASNDPFHIELERLADKIWVPGEQSRWFYERARGQYEVARNRTGTSPARRRKFEEQVPKSQKFTKTDLARYYNAWEQRPEIVSLGAQKNFIYFMTHLAKKWAGFNPDEAFYKDLIAKAILYKTAESIARKHKFSAYRANAVAYTVALLSFKTVGRLDLGAIWVNQEISRALYDVLYDWMPVVLEEIIETAGTRNVTEWAKKSDCCDRIEQLDVMISEELERELREGDPLPNVGRAAKKGKLVLSTVDRQNINKVMQHDADTWWEIGKWAKKASSLKEFQIGIVMTIATYAADDWKKIPSAKQSKYAVEVLQIAEEEGLLHKEEEVA